MMRNKARERERETERERGFVERGKKTRWREKMAWVI
jgi:hypothetical protein